MERLKGKSNEESREVISKAGTALVMGERE